MKSIYIIKLFLIASFSVCFQSIILGATFTTAGGTGLNWSSAARWTLVSGTPATTYPTALDDAIITGGVTVNIPGVMSCRNLLIDGTGLSNTININGFFASLTINGTLLGTDANGAPTPSTTANIINGPYPLIFTGSNIGGYGPLITTEIIAAWNNNNQISANVNFNLASNRSIDYITLDGTTPSSMDFSGNVTVSSGTLSNGSFLISDIRITSPTSIFSISTGASTSLSIPITNDGTNRINQLTNNGTITSSSFINSSTFTLGSGGVFNTSYSGTEGWWSGTSSPTTISINDNSIVNYNGMSSQNIFPTQYGELQLNSSTKNLYSIGALFINMDFRIGTSTVFDCSLNSNTIHIKGNLVNNGAWSPNKEIIFDGVGSQVISGSGSTSFDGGLSIGTGTDVNSVSLSHDLATTNILIQSSSTFSPGTNNITLSGDWTNNGTLTTGTATTTFNGTSVLGGTASTLFNNCVVTGSVDLNSSIIAFNGLTNNGTINCNAFTMSLGGSFTNNNTFNRGTGTVVFNGTGTQNVSGSSSTSFHNLTISNLTAATDVVNINSNVDLYNILTLNGNGHIDADGSSDTGGLTLISGDNGTAKIGTIGSGAVFDGNVTTQRRIVPATVGWRHISTPVKNQTLASWTDDFSVQGVIGGPDPSYNPIVFNYDETLGTDTNNGVDGWQAFTNVTDNISNTGIRVYFFANQLTPTLILDNTGPPVIGNGIDNTVLGTEKYTIPVDFTSTAFDGGGWNLIENPYPCEIDYESVISSVGKDGGLVNVDNGIYIWNPSVGQSGNYGSYVGGVSTNSVTQYIASGQAFFVKANGTGPNGTSLSYIEDDKVTNHGNTFIREGSIDNVLKMIIASDDNINRDEAAVRFRSGSSEDFESEFDAYKLANGWINISTLPKEDLDLSINTLGELKDVESVIIRIMAYKSGAFNLTFDGLDSFGESASFLLLDKYLETSTAIDLETKYSFQIATEVPETFGNDRFELQVVSQKRFIRGEVKTFDGDFVSEVTVSAENAEETVFGVTDNQGVYSLEALEPSEYRISAARLGDQNYRSGVTVHDIIRSVRHLLKWKPFTNPYQYISADVNASKSITALDLVEMRILILGWKKEFSGGNNWLFIPETIDLSEDPFDFETFIDVSLEDSDVNMDFVAVKVGDVNNSWESSNVGRESKGSIEMSLEDLMVDDEFIEIPVVVKDFNDISGYQFSVTWDPTQLEFNGVEHSALEGYTNEKFIDEGVLTTMWVESDGASVALDEGSILFVLKFVAKDKNANSLVELNSAITEAVAYDSKLNELTIKSTAANVNLEKLRNGALELFQNVPNPFDYSTDIEFNIAKPGIATLSIVNSIGATVFRHEQNYEPGGHSINWNKGQSLSRITPGVYLYRLESNDESVIKKMIIK